MKFRKAMKEKRTGKQGKSKDPRRNKEEIVVQRLTRVSDQESLFK